MFGKRRKKPIVYNQKSLSHKISSLFRLRGRQTGVQMINLRQQPSFTKKKILMWLSTFVLVITFIAGVYLIVFSGKFNVQKIIVELKEGSITNAEDIEISLSSFLGDNIFSISPVAIESFVQEIYPFIKEVHIQKKYPSVLRVETIEYQKVALVLMDKGKFIINEKGDVVGTDIEEGLDLLKIYYTTDRQPYMYQNLVKFDHLYFIFAQLKYIYTGLNETIKQVYFDEISKEVRYKLNNDWIIRLELGQNLSNYIEAIKLSVAEIDLSKTVVKEIDIRVPGKIFIQKEDIK